MVAAEEAVEAVEEEVVVVAKAADCEATKPPVIRAAAPSRAGMPRRIGFLLRCECNELPSVGGWMGFPDGGRKRCRGTRLSEMASA